MKNIFLAAAAFTTQMRSVLTIALSTVTFLGSSAGASTIDSADNNPSTNAAVTSSQNDAGVTIITGLACTEGQPKIGITRKKSRTHQKSRTHRHPLPSTPKQSIGQAKKPQHKHAKGHPHHPHLVTVESNFVCRPLVGSLNFQLYPDFISQPTGTLPTKPAVLDSDTTARDIMDFANGGYDQVTTEYTYNPYICPPEDCGPGGGSTIPFGGGWGGGGSGGGGSGGGGSGGGMGGVPEPTTWASMIVGFGLAGVTLRAGRPKGPVKSKGSALTC